jgi:hypothetical protein
LKKHIKSDLDMCAPFFYNLFETRVKNVFIMGIRIMKTYDKNIDLNWNSNIEHKNETKSQYIKRKHEVCKQTFIMIKYENINITKTKQDRTWD